MLFKSSRLRSSTPSASPCASPSAFTLVELLVVIGIIAVLIGILLPTLNRARAQSQAVVCQSNIRQILLAFQLYSNYNKCIPGTSDPTVNLKIVPGQIPPFVWLDIDWCGIGNNEWNANKAKYKHPLQTSVLYQYLKSPEILTCPTERRANNTYFDYTMLMSMCGAKPGLRSRMGYPTKPADPNSPTEYFQGLLLIIEEDPMFYNNNKTLSPDGVDDGAFSWEDQFAATHFGQCNLGFLDGSVATFKSPKGKSGAKQEPQDLQANHLRLYANGGTFDAGKGKEWGWVNRPK